MTQAHYGPAVSLHRGRVVDFTRSVHYLVPGPVLPDGPEFFSQFGNTARDIRVADNAETPVCPRYTAEWTLVHGEAVAWSDEESL